MQFSAIEFADMLLNHPSHWKIMEMVKLFPAELAAHVLEKHELEMKHSYEMGQLNDHIRYLNKTIVDLTEKNKKLSNDVGNLSKRVRELKAEVKK
jgi:predicted nuclease with TOPRIM domain